MNILLLITAILLIIIITMQAKGNGLSIIPGSGDFGKFERRGPEKILHQITIGLVVVFTVLAMISYFLA
jgi:protein translocase SecG subunit